MFYIKLIKRSLCTAKATSRNDTLLQGLFIRKIREYISKQASAPDGLVDCTPEVKRSMQDELNRLAKKFHFEEASEVQKLPNFSFKNTELENPVDMIRQAIIETKKEELEISEKSEEELAVLSEMEREMWQDWVIRKQKEMETLREHVKAEEAKETLTESLVWDPDKPFKFPEDSETATHTQSSVVSKS